MQNSLWFTFNGHKYGVCMARLKLRQLMGFDKCDTSGPTKPLDRFSTMIEIREIIIHTLQFL